MMDLMNFVRVNWQWIIGVVAVPIICAIIGVAFKKAGRKQKVGDIRGNGNSIINGDVK